MKVYNITNMKKFMDKISEVCKDKVEFLNENGQCIEVIDGTVPPTVYPFYYLKGTISELNLRFSNPNDAVAILTYLTNIGLAS